MANRPVYVSVPRFPFYQQVDVEFTYNAGFSVVQKQKNIEAIHKTFVQRKPGSLPLEISSKSMQPLGIELSAFNLKKYIPSLEISIPVENAYQGGKKYVGGGPYTDLYYVSPKEAKRDERHNTSGYMSAFNFEGVDYPLIPSNGFYDWLYIQALRENKEFAEQIMKYDSFTDIEFNPNKSINCQARAASMFVGISKAGLMDQTRDFYDFCELIMGKSDSLSALQVSQENKVETKKEEVVFCEGQVIKHPVWGEGKIVSINGTCLKIVFECGEKTLSSKWVSEKCTY